MGTAKVTTAIWLLVFALQIEAQQASTRTQQISLHAQQAKQYLTENQPARAIPEFRAILALDPDNIDARGNLGVLLFFQGDYTLAIPELRSALKLQPKLWKIQALLGMAEKRTGEAGPSLKDLENSFTKLEEKDIQIEVGMELVEAYSGEDDVGKAARTVDFLREKYPTDATVLYASYRVHSDAAGEAMLSLSLVAPHSALMHQLMAHELARQGQMEGAIRNYREAIKMDPKLPGLHFELAEALNASDAQAGRAEAKTEYEAALSLNPADEKSECRLGAIDYREGDTNGSFSHYSRATRLQPDDPEAALGLAKVLLLKNEPQKAQALLEHALQLDPTTAEAHFRLAMLYRDQGRRDDAKQELAQYQKFKDAKEKLKAIYREMRVQPAKQEPEESDSR
jgi:cytochrome c-type biogenesis protein CcmH/NrfG